MSSSQLAQIPDRCPVRGAISYTPIRAGGCGARPKADIRAVPPLVDPHQGIRGTLPAIQQGTIDGAVLALTVDATMRYYDAAKYITETNQPFIFSMGFLSKKWFDALPGDLQKILDTDAGKAAAEVNPWAADFYRKEAEVWKEHGEIINLPAAEQAEMMKTLQSVGADVSKSSPDLEQAYNVFVAVAKRTK